MASSASSTLAFSPEQGRAQLEEAQREGKSSQRRPDQLLTELGRRNEGLATQLMELQQQDPRAYSQALAELQQVMGNAGVLALHEQVSQLAAQRLPSASPGAARDSGLEPTEDQAAPAATDPKASAPPEAQAMAPSQGDALSGDRAVAEAGRQANAPAARSPSQTSPEPRLTTTQLELHGSPGGAGDPLARIPPGELLHTTGEQLAQSSQVWKKVRWREQEGFVPAQGLKPIADLGPRRVKQATWLCAEPSADPQKLANLETGQELQVLEQRRQVAGAEWILARQGETSGWVRTDRLTYAERRTKTKVRLQPEPKEPSSDGGAGAELAPDTTVTLRSAKIRQGEGEWIQVEAAGGAQGWIKTSELAALRPQELGANGYRKVDLERFLSGGSSAPAAIVVGTSEGTRTASGGKTSAYEGHKDPGNGRKNQGSFSYQHGAKNGEEADRAWLKTLRSVCPSYEAAAKKAGLDPSNALLAASFFDLYTQSPAAATGEGGYLEQFPSLAKKGLSAANIIDARVEAFRVPGTARCGGFGGSWEKTRADQTRRVQALATALTAQGYGAEADSGGGSAAADASGPLAQLVAKGRYPERGAKGDAVRQLQRYLGLPSAAQDGDFGPATERAVKAFQAKAGLGRDGVVGPATLKALQARSAGGGSQPAGGSEPSAADAGAGEAEATLRRGAEGPAVKTLQSLLGLPEAAQDGKFGPGTESAVWSFQREHRLGTDGVVGPATWKRLRAAKAQTAALEQALAGGKVFQEGDKGPEVKEIQRLLGFSAGGQTALFGPDTAKAVRALQKQSKLEESGKVGQTTYAALKRAHAALNKGVGGSGAAAKLLNHKNVSFSYGTRDPKGDNRSGAYQNIVDAAAGKPGWTSKRSDVGATQVALSAKMLEGLLKAADAGYSIEINFILGGDHSSTSYHYRGKAVDLHTVGSFSKLKAALGASGDSQNEGDHYHFSWP